MVLNTGGRNCSLIKIKAFGKGEESQTFLISMYLEFNFFVNESNHIIACAV